MSNSEEGAWQPSWKEGWVVLGVNRDTKPSLEEGHALSCKEGKEKRVQPAPKSLWGLEQPLLFPSRVGQLSPARKGHYVQCH